MSLNGTIYIILKSLLFYLYYRPFKNLREYPRAAITLGRTRPMMSIVCPVTPVWHVRLLWLQELIRRWDSERELFYIVHNRGQRLRWL